MTAELVVLLDGHQVGRVQRQTSGRLTFVYTPEWLESKTAYPLSISMPLARTAHGNKVIESYLWGLLPDNAAILDHWSRRFQVSARSPFGLVSHVGEDCAGAVQFVRPERIEACIHAAPEPTQWLSESDVADRLRLLRTDHSAWRGPRDAGQFSLAGAQPKTAFLLEDGRWGVPSGRTPTTHILKPPSGAFGGQAENEHYCLNLARRLGLPTAASTIRRFDEEVAIIIERYDRHRTSRGIRRIHQEDLCQAMGMTPSRKYENEGGPGVRPIVDLLRQHSADREGDVSTFLRAVAFNWLIGGTDAHAKNYSLLLGTGGRARLAPLYDLISALPYDEFQHQKLKLAMRIGKDYRLKDIGRREWMKLARDVRWSPDDLIQEVAGMAERLPDEVSAVRERMLAEGIGHDVVGRLSQRLSERAIQCARTLAGT